MKNSPWVRDYCVFFNIDGSLVDVENFNFPVWTTEHGGLVKDINENELMDYYAEDPGTDVLAMYLESFADPQGFLERCRRIVSHKPVILLKAGRSEAGARAVQLHTGSLAGSDRATGMDIGVLEDNSEYFRDVRKKYVAYESAFTAVDPAVLLWQIPGGMISNLSSQLKEQGSLDRMPEVLAEVPRVRQELGYPPLVTPTSQIVGTQATLNVLMGRYKMITKETKAYMQGFYGRAPGPVDPEVQKLCIGDETPITSRPADSLEPELPKRRAELEELGISPERWYGMIDFVEAEDWRPPATVNDAGWLPLTECWHAPTGEPSVDAMAQYLWTPYLLTTYIVETFGHETVRLMSDGLSKAASMEEWIDTVTGQPLEDLELAWREWVIARWREGSG